MEKLEVRLSLIEKALKQFKGQPVITIISTSVDTLLFIRKLEWDFGKDLNGGYISISDPFETETILTLYLDNIRNVLYRKFENILYIYFKDGVKMNITRN